VNSEQCIVESSSLSSPPAFTVSTASHYSSSSPSPSCSAFSIVHVACEQWRAAHHWPPPFQPPATALPLPLLLLLCLLHFPLFTLHVNNGEQLTTSLHRFHRQPLLFLFSFLLLLLLSFSFIFCILLFRLLHSPLFT